MRYILLSLLLFSTLSMAQQLPSIDAPIIPLKTISVYLSPAGSDSNPGTFNAPKKTFTAAFNALSFNNSTSTQNYGEIILLAGHYYPTQTNNLVQNISRWRTGTGPNYTYANISIKGRGHVAIHGDSLANGIPIIQLMGSGIELQNIMLQDAKAHGIRIIGSAINPHHDLLIDSISVDSCDGFGLWVEGYKRVEIKNSSFIANCQTNAFEDPTANCQWPSGLRVHRSSHLNIHHCTVARNWGEGLNTSLDNYLNVHDNTVYDNYSCNIYNHSSSNAIYSYNYIYNNDSRFFRNCINGSGKSAAGISLANELTCTNGCLLYSNSCGSKFTCCAETDYDHPVPQSINHLQIDSVFIFNNIIANAGVSIWDAYSGFANYGYLANVYLVHNTIINDIGKNTSTQSPLNVSLGTPYVYINKIHIANNIIAIDTSILTNTNLVAVANPNICSANWSNALLFSKNIWTTIPSNLSFNFTTDTSLFIPNLSYAPIAADMLYGNYCPSDKTDPINLCGNQTLDWRTNLIFPFITDDFKHELRYPNDYNVGALERIACLSTDKLLIEKVKIYPNPTNGSQIYIEANEAIKEIVIINLNGSVIKKINSPLIDRNITIDLSSQSSGLYLLQITYPNNTLSTHKLTILPHD